MSDTPEGSTPQAPAHDTEAAVAFLRRRVEVDGVRPLLLSASRVDVNTGEKAEFFSRNFGPTPKWDEVAKWIEQGQGTCNLYYSDCVLTDDYTAHNKARAYTDSDGKPGHVQSVVMLHADIDPRKDETPTACVERSLHALQRLKLPKPSHAVMSGGGVQFFWLLEDPLPINCDDARAEKAKRYNGPLAGELGGDTSGANVDHIYRIPGTVNIPTKAKRVKGRVELTVSRVLWDEGHKHSRDRFKVAPDPNEAVAKPAPRANTGPKPETEKNGKPAAIISSAPKVESFDDPRVASLSDDTKRIMEHGEDPEHPKDSGKDMTRSAWSFDFCCRAIRDGLPDDVLFAILTDPRWKISASVLDKKKPARQARRDIDGAHKVVIKDAKSIIVNKHDHLSRARIFIENDAPHVVYYKGNFHDYEQGAYLPIAEERVRARVYLFLDTCLVPSENDDKPGYVRCCPNGAMVTETVACVKALVALDDNINQPHWLDGRNMDAENCVSFPNGILDLKTMDFHAPDPNYFTASVLSFDYDPNAPRPETWLDYFLPGVFANEQDQIELLQEVIGYLLGPDFNLEKFFGIYGPPRSGKDTIARVIRGMLSELTVVGPTLDSMSDRFGMEALVGKALAVVGDMRLSGKQDAAVAENILKLVGRSHFTFDRKYEAKWSGYLPTKLLLLANETLRLADSSGAIARRHIVLRTRTSYYGKEDADLYESRLLPELPGIFLWAMEGLKRLRDRKHFVETKRAKHEREQIERDGSPEKAFIDDCLTLNSKDGHTDKDALYEAFLDFLHEQGKKHTPDKATFFRKFKSALESAGMELTQKRLRENSTERVYVIPGILISSPAKRRPAAKGTTRRDDDGMPPDDNPFN